ncbi:MAG TPA: multicopper oxidase domain-containing protein, partial [Candidatus Limnocylindrales bacterium]
MERTGSANGEDPRETITRRSLLAAGAVAGGGLVATTLAACTPAAASAGWTFPPAKSEVPGAATPSAAATAVASAAPSDAAHVHDPSASGAPSTDHDANAKAVVDRFLGGEGASMSGAGNQPLEPTLDGTTKVFDMTVDAIKHQTDAQGKELDALGFNGTWPGPRLEVVEGDRVRATFTNRMAESTGIHFHGQRLPNAMDGVPHITQAPIPPGGSFSYEFEAKTTGSHMYHSHHNATDQVGRGLLGAFIVQPKDPALRY